VERLLQLADIPLCHAIHIEVYNATDIVMIVDSGREGYASSLTA
jgi:hypothetical protein